MGGLRPQQDAFGRALYDHHLGRTDWAVVERSDGAVEPMGMAPYLLPYADWRKHKKKGIALAKGRALDVGCGAGRVALHLQRKGMDVLGIDNSPMAVKLCKLRGVRKVRVLPVAQVSRKLGAFDTIVLYGNNFGLLENARRARWLLRRFAGMTSPAARILAETNDPYQTSNPLHLRYHRRNRAAGRMSGQVRIRVRYRDLATPYFDYLMVSKDEMRRIVDGTGWQIARFIDSPGSIYIAVLEKETER